MAVDIQYTAMFLNLRYVQVPKQQPKEVCYNVPREECQQVPKQVPKEECRQVPREECQQVPKQVPKQVPNNQHQISCHMMKKNWQHPPSLSLSSPSFLLFRFPGKCARISLVRSPGRSQSRSASCFFRNKRRHFLEKPPFTCLISVQVCNQVAKEECYNVPRQVEKQECREVPRQVALEECKNVPRQVPAQKCTNIPRQVRAVCCRLLLETLLSSLFFLAELIQKRLSFAGAKAGVQAGPS